MQKLYSSITIVILTLTLAFPALAQPVGGVSYIGDYSKMASKTAMDEEMESGSWMYRLENLKNAKYTFRVILKDNSVREIKSRIYAEKAFNKSYITYTVDDRPNQIFKLFCDETMVITRLAGSERIDGLVTDSCWLFKVVSGKINAYSFLAKADGPYSIIALQTGDGPIKNFNSHLLEGILSDDAEAEKLFSKKEYLKAIEKYNLHHP
jgi:hypothetical protein